MQRYRQRGVTLIEVLIALLVLSIGLLGLATLQLTGLQNGQQSLQRSQASVLVYEIADRMRANSAQAASGAYLIATPATPGTAPTAPSTDCSKVSCTPAQLATYDLYDWRSRLVSTLTGATTKITCAASPCVSGTVQTITVMWDEYRKGATGTTCPVPPPSSAATAGNNLSCFSISLTP